MRFYLSWKIDEIKGLVLVSYSKLGAGVDSTTHFLNRRLYNLGLMSTSFCKLMRARYAPHLLNAQISPLICLMFPKSVQIPDLYSGVLLCCSGTLWGVR